MDVWRGPAVIHAPQGRRTSTQTERVGPMLGGSIRLIEGQGYAADGAPTPSQAFSGRVWIGNWTILAVVSAVSITLAATLRGEAGAWAPGFAYMAVPVLIGVGMAIRFRQLTAVRTVDTGDSDA